MLRGYRRGDCLVSAPVPCVAVYIRNHITWAIHATYSYHVCSYAGQHPHAPIAQLLPNRNPNPNPMQASTHTPLSPNYYRSEQRWTGGADMVGAAAREAVTHHHSSHIGGNTLSRVVCMLTHCHVVSVC